MMNSIDESKKNSSSSGDDDCPICLCAPSDESGDNPVVTTRAHGPCGHNICLSCMETILLSSHREGLSNRYHDDNHPDAHLSAPTLGRCPICRSELSLFDIIDSNNKELLVPKDYNIGKSRIAGGTYAVNKAFLGYGSYHFPPDLPPNGNDENSTSIAGDTCSNNTGSNYKGEWEGKKTDSRGLPLPYINYTAAIENNDQSFTLDNTSTFPPGKMYFRDGCHFHDKSNTFHGTIDWSSVSEGVTFDGSSIWDIIMQFSSDLRYVNGGMIIKRHTTNDDYSWPLDGRWKVTWEGTDLEEIIDVVAGAWSLGPFEYRLNLSDGTPKFVWPMKPYGDKAVVQTAVSGVDLESHPEGPTIGQTIVWTTTDPGHQKILWERQTIGGSPPDKVERFGPAGHLYRNISGSCSRSESIPNYHAHTIWKNVFIQGFKVGLASYHFLSEDESYISYEHPACGHWPALDDGSPIPSKVYFRETNWDPSERVFRGKINWQLDHGTTWQGCRQWIYDIKFDSEFTCILSGSVQSVVAEDGTMQEMSTYGNSLVYVNAAIMDRFYSLMSQVGIVEERRETSEAQEEENSNIRYQRFVVVRRDLQERLQRERVPVRTMTMMLHCLSLTQQEESTRESAFDFNL